MIKTSRIAAALVLAASASIAAAQPSGAPAAGAALYERHCSVCHDEGRGAAPEDLARLAPEAAYSTISSGGTHLPVAALTEAERRAVVEHVTGASLDVASLASSEWMPNQCTSEPGVAASPSASRWVGWGGDVRNARFRGSDRGGLAAHELSDLELRWAFAFPGATAVSAQATVADGRVYVATNTGAVYALDAASGCVHWSFEADTEVRGAITLGEVAEGALGAFFGDRSANAYAVDAQSGALLWRTRLDEHAAARVTGAPAYHEGRLYVPVSSSEEGAGANPNYECCTFRGSVVALDAHSGERVWKSYAIAEEPRPTVRNAAGAQMWAPSGAAIWSPPTLDPARSVLYVATGNAYSEPASDNINSVLAMALDTGEIVWAVNASSDDVWLAGCAGAQPGANCPEDLGPDHDFGAPPILITRADGTDVLIAGQKSGIVWAYDPDAQGELLWKTALVENTTEFGGKIIWGGASDDENVYFGLGTGGIAGVRLRDGHLQWFTPLQPAPEVARHVGQDGPLTAITGAVFSGGWDGVLRALSSADGQVLWEFDTAREFEAVNGLYAKGGSMGAIGPTLAERMLFVPSGYVGVKSGMPGNALLMLAPREP